MPVRALIAAGELFGITDNSVRVSLARLCATGRVARDARGAYRLGPAAAAVDGHLQRWRHAHEQLRSWPLDAQGYGAWVGVHTSGLTPSLQEGRALRLMGLRQLQPGATPPPET